MAATIAHEINNPLEAVMNLLYLLRPMITDPEGINYLSSAEDELGRVSHIAKQTLGYYRENATASSASLAEIVLHAITIYEPRCTAAGIEIRKSLHSSRKILLRRGEMMQVISNLIVNSIYAMPAGGVLTISVEDAKSSRDGILLTIQDNGVGKMCIRDRQPEGSHERGHGSWVLPRLLRRRGAWFRNRDDGR